MRILALILGRLAWLVPTLAGLIAIVFVISRVIPADPVALLAGETASRAQVEQLRRKLGLDRPLLGIPLGVLAALYRNRPLDHVLRVVTVAGLAMASFWLALMLQLYFAMDLRWLPLQARISGFPPHAVTGFYLIDAALQADIGRLGDALAHLVLPAATLAFPALATVVRFTRAGVLETLQRNYVMYQRAMGIPAGLIVWKYVLRNSLLSTVTQIGLLFGILLAGAVVVETVFQWPGIGAYAFEAILHADYAAVMGFTVYAGVVFGIVNLGVDICHALLDPRRGGA